MPCRESGAQALSSLAHPFKYHRPVDNLAYLHGLCALRPGLTALRLRALLEVAGSAEAAWHADEALLARAGWSDDARKAFTRHRARWNVAAEADALTSAQIGLVPLPIAARGARAASLKFPREAPIRVGGYPSLLQQIYDPPIALYLRGTSAISTAAVAIVGSRKATPYGRTATCALVKPLASKGITIVSGLAYGIDAEAHRAALAVQGHTLAVLGSGVDEPSLYPRAHRMLAREIVAAGGAVVSEFPPRTEARPEYFPQRNRVIAGIARIVVVVEAASASGALITARCALAENRDVMAVPGPITSPSSEGTNRLLQEGAAPACSADDILEALALDDVFTVGRSATRTLRGQRPTTQVPLLEPALGQPLPGAAATADQLVALLSMEPKNIDALVLVSTLPTHEVSAILTLLELAGRVRDVGGKNYVLT